MDWRSYLVFLQNFSICGPRRVSAMFWPSSVHSLIVFSLIFLTGYLALSAFNVLSQKKIHKLGRTPLVTNPQQDTLLRPHTDGTPDASRTSLAGHEASSIRFTESSATRGVARTTETSERWECDVRQSESEIREGPRQRCQDRYHPRSGTALRAGTTAT